MRRNARRGLAWYEQGLAGEGVVARTVREARDMASGSISEDKCRRMAAWFARHMVDLNAPDADPEADGYPSPGVVAHALWGGGTRAQSERAMRWAKARVAEMDGADAPTQGRALPDDHEGDVVALGAMAIRALDVPGIAQAIREGLGAER